MWHGDQGRFGRVDITMINIPVSNVSATEGAVGIAPTYDVKTKLAVANFKNINKNTRAQVHTYTQLWKQICNEKRFGQLTGCML